MLFFYFKTAKDFADHIEKKITYLKSGKDMNEQKLREEICRIGRFMYEKNMVAANDGNISARLENGVFLCTPTGVSKGLMTPDMICKVDISGKVIADYMNAKSEIKSENESGKRIYKPSSEIKMHLRVYEKRPDVNAAVHAHPPYATTYAIANEPLERPITAEAVLAIGKVPVADYGTPSTAEIPDNVEKFVEEYNAVLLANHGALTWGQDLMSAYMRMETVEFYARMLFQTELLGRAKELDEEEIAKIRTLNKPY